MIEIRFLTLANREVDDAVRWYEAKEQGVSRDFLDELDRVVRLIRHHPLAGMQIETEIRRFPLTRFPYFLIYGIEKNGRNSPQITQITQSGKTGGTRQEAGARSRPYAACPHPRAALPHPSPLPWGEGENPSGRGKPTR